MTRCPEFYDKFEKDGNFCGLTPAAISQIKAYNEMRAAVAKHIQDKAFIVDNFPEFAARAISTYAKDDETKNKALNYVVACLKRQEKVTHSDLKTAIQDWLKPDSCDISSRRKGSGKVYVRKVETPPVPVENPPEAPIAQTLKERYGGTEHQHHVGNGPDAAINPVIINDTYREKPGATNMFQTGAELMKQQSEGIAGEMFPNWSPEVCRSGKCPDGANHREIGKHLGDKCAMSGSFLRDVTFCPIIEKAKRETASAPAKTCAVTGGAVRREMPPLVAKRNGMEEVVFHPTPKQQEFVDRVMRLEQLATAEEAISQIVDWQMEMQEV